MTAGKLACSLCGGAAAPFGERDFNDSCNDAFTVGRNFSPSGEMVPYDRCGDCGFIFSRWFDEWAADDFKRRIYNGDYGRADPPFERDRPAKLAVFLADLLDQSTRILDYGGGNGVLAERLRERGFDATNYDPFHGQPAPDAGARFDLVTAFEVVEHVPDQAALFATALSYMAHDGAFLFTTLLQPDDIAEQGMGWWYACPRNGHLALHTRASLGHAVAAAGDFTLRHLNDEAHLVYRSPPPWAAPFIDGTRAFPPVNDPLPG